MRNVQFICRGCGKKFAAEVFEEGEYVHENMFIGKVSLKETEFVYKGFTLVKSH